MIALIPVAIQGTAVAFNIAKGFGLLMSTAKVANSGRIIGKNLYKMHQTKKEQELLRTEDAMKTAVIATGIGLAGYAGKKILDKRKRTSVKTSNEVL